MIGLSGVIAISAGTGAHSLALRNDGTVWGWGYHNHGQLGDGTRGDPSCACRTTPVQTERLADVTAISAGVGHSLALRAGS